MEKLTKNEQKKLEKLFEDGCKNIEIKSEYWIDGYDQSLSFCQECAEKRIQELRKEYPDEGFYLDGGWGTEGDSIPYCVGCNCLLNGSLLLSGCVDEVNYFLEHGFDLNSEEDCYSMAQVIDSGWESWNDNPDEKDLYKLCRQILNNLDKEK